VLKLCEETDTGFTQDGNCRLFYLAGMASDPSTKTSFVGNVRIGLNMPVNPPVASANMRSYFSDPEDFRVDSTSREPTDLCGIFVLHSAEDDLTKLVGQVVTFAKQQYRSTETLTDTSSFSAHNFNRIVHVGLKYDGSLSSNMARQNINLTASRAQSSTAIGPYLWSSKYPWLEQATGLERIKHSDQALRVIYKQINGWLMSGEGGIEKCDQLLQSVIVSIDDFSVDFLLAFLSITLRFHTQLKNRPEFFRRVSASLRDRGIPDRPLLNGLG
jgi:hypothetical protein